MQRESVTIHFPQALLVQAKSLKVEDESFNDFVVGALKLEVSRRQAIAAHKRICKRRDAVQQRTGIQPDSSTDIRELRESNRLYE